jgi:hypothetical protein
MKLDRALAMWMLAKEEKNISRTFVDSKRGAATRSRVRATALGPMIGSAGIGLRSPLDAAAPER